MDWFMFDEKKNKLVQISMAVILLVSMFFLSQKGAELVSSDGAVVEKEICVVLDAGHGGADPGKVGINGALEKDVNLQIACQVRDFLEAEGIKVVMTRDDDVGLYAEDSSNKKVQDMKRRMEVIRQADPQIVVSIHQNSYHEEYVNGAQVFYYTDSEKSRELAQMIQKRFVINVDPNNKRVEKGNTSYYLLKKTAVPIVIVECGFMSNMEEAEKLCSKTYQEKVAWAVHMGIIQYLNKD